MAILAYPFEVRDSANTTTDNRKTGLTPTVGNGKTIAATPATVLASTVTIVEVISGHYAALYDAEANGDAAFPIDCAGGLTSPNDRYITLDLTRDPGRIIANLDSPISGIVNSIALGQTAFTVVADVANSTTTFTVSGLAASPASYLNMQIEFTTGSAANLKTRKTITAAATNGSNIKITVDTPFGTVPSAATPDTGSVI